VPEWKPVFSDDFPEGEDIDRTKWESPVYTEKNNKAFLGRTGIRNPKDFEGEIGRIPCTAARGAKLRLGTYNPKAPAHDTFLGSEMHTIKKWGGGGETVKFEARVASPDMPGGAVTSVFAYALCSGRQVQNEVDFEFASNHWGPPPDNDILTNVFVCSSGAGKQPKVHQETGYGLLDRHTFSLIHTPGQSVEWLVDERSFYKETQFLPDLSASGGMSLYMNFWAPAAGWTWAYNSGLQPVSEGPGTTWDYYVKRAAVYYWK
jgi:hypothetical protein